MQDTNPNVEKKVYAGVRRAVNITVQRTAPTDVQYSGLFARYTCGYRLQPSSSGYRVIYYSVTNTLEDITVPADLMECCVFDAVKGDNRSRDVEPEQVTQVVKTLLRVLPRIVSFGEMFLGLTQYNCKTYKLTWIQHNTEKDKYVCQAWLSYVFNTTQTGAHVENNIYVVGSIDDTEQRTRILWEPTQSDMLHTVWLSKRTR